MFMSIRKKLRRFRIILFDQTELRMPQNHSYSPNDRIIHRIHGPGMVTYVGMAYIGLRFETQGNILLQWETADISPWSLEAESVWLEEAKSQARKALSDPVLWPESTFDFEESEAVHSMGSHWQPFVDDAAEMLRNLPQMLAQAQIMEGFGLHRPVPKELPSKWSQGFHLVWPMQRQGVILTCRINADNKTTEMASLYPFWSEGIQHTLTLNHVKVWKSGVEAQITAGLGEAEMTFFDAHFLTNRLWYRQGGHYDFILTGLAYSAQPARLMELPYSPNPDVLAWRTLLTGDHDDGEPAESPTVLCLEGMASLLPITDWDNDDHSFRGPVKSVKPFADFLGQDGWLVRVTVLRLSDYETEDVNLDIVITRRAWQGDGVPVVGADMEGTLWLQGYLWMPQNT
jgi:hypothetical protein